MPKFIDRLQHAWNAFRGRDRPSSKELGSGSYYRPDRRVNVLRGNDKSIVTSVINRISVDVASVNILHARVDSNGNYVDTIKDSLNDCLTLEANIDQTGQAFFIDLASTMLSGGCVAAVPIETSIDPNISSSYEIESIRVGLVTQWFPKYVQVNVYNQLTGLREEIVVPKEQVAIIQNPFYDVMNEPNSTLQRLIRKLSLLDSVDEQVSAGKLDMIIQLPYTIRSEARREQAEHRRKDIEMQLRDSKYGIAYTDATEKITQLNRPLENNLLNQIEYLTNQLYSQLGITPEVLNGTASEETMLNYFNRTVEPILTAIADEFKRKFLTKTARTQGQSILFIRNPFKLVPLSKIAEIVDKFTANEILTSNEIRGIIGYRPVENDRANQLINKNINPLELQGTEDPTLALPDGNQNETYFVDENQGGSIMDRIGNMPVSEFNAMIMQQQGPPD
jgi:hypothetical protein